MIPLKCNKNFFKNRFEDFKKYANIVKNEVKYSYKYG